MKQLFLTSTPDQVYTLKEQAGLIYAGFEGYLDYLSTELEVLELPRAIVWTDYQTASQTISDIPIPAYTNDYRTVMSPQIDIWKEIYLSQLKGIKTDAFVSKKVQAYYARLSVNNVKQILGHEFVHWSNLFSDEAYEENRWFEEGMAEYISRKFFLTTAEYKEEKEINKMLVDCYEKCHGKTCLSEFTVNTYIADYSTVFHYYWKSFLKVEEIIDKQKGDIRTVIDRFNAGDIK